MIKTKIIALVMTIVLLVGTGAFNEGVTVQAATESERKGFEIDENLYNVNWEETKKVYVYYEGDDDCDDYDLGYAVVATGYATTKKPVSGCYYQRILVKAEMVPQTISGDLKGMSQYLTVKLTNEDLMQNKNIQPSSDIGETKYTASNSVMLNLGGDVTSENGVYKFKKGGSLNIGVSSSCEYIEDSLIITTNKDDNGYGVWEYDYVSSKSNKTQNAYLFGSSEQYGLYSWNMPYNHNGFYVCLKIKVIATFGAGYKQKNQRLESSSGSYNLGKNSCEKRIIWN